MSRNSTTTRLINRLPTPRTVSSNSRSGSNDREASRNAITYIDDAATVRPWPVRDETITFQNVVLESGARVDELSVHFRLEGALSAARDNLVLVIHALTGTAHASQWWKGIIERDGAIDPTRHAVLCANLLGGCNGTTGPSNDNPNALPAFTTRDQAAVLALLLDALAVQQPLLICGGSLGGMVALEFAASFPERVRSAVVLAAPAAQTTQGIVWGAIMQRAIAIGGVEDGLALARMVGMLSYRTPEGLERRFGRARNTNGEFLVRDWLNAHAEKLVQRFDATSYVALLSAMDAHDIGRGRGGIAAALSPIGDRLTGVGIPGDLLYSAESVREWTTAANASYIDLPSIHGHDGFLLETTRVSAILRGAIERAAASASSKASTNTSAAASATTVAPSTRSSSSSSSGNIPVVSIADSSPRRDASTRIASEQPQRTLRVALAGCGHVGGSLLELFSERRASESVGVHVERILMRDAHRPRPALAHAIARGIVSDSARITEPANLVDDDVDVLVEAIGGTTTARTLIETALSRGIRVVTANKALLAERGPQLVALARSNRTRIDFEGAVAGAIPIIRSVRSGAAGVGITRIAGILNGTSNFVLERVAEGASLAEAVATAQRLGYAESDPTRDLSGEDAEDKLRILAWLSFGIEPTALKVTRRGIDAETAAWAARVAAEGDRVKLIASCTQENDELIARIIPTRVTSDDAWATVTGALNRIVIDSASAGSLVFHGPGAGGRATAGAVLGDVLSPG